MRTTGMIPLFLALALACPAAEPAAAPSFSRKPTATRDGEKVRIEFAADRGTDVAVYVENAQGKIVRHLAAGVLGKNAPEPLKADSLEQSVEWDGKDDDGQAVLNGSGGPFKARVGLGLKANWGGVAFADPDKAGPNRIERVGGLACGPDGRLYVLDFADAWVFGNSSKVLVLRRDGSYEKTIKPFPPTLPRERVKGLGVFENSWGAANPVIFSTNQMSFYPQQEVAHQPAVTPDGRIVLAGYTGNQNSHNLGVPTLAMLDGDGGLPNATYAGPGLAKATWRPAYSETAPPCLASATDGKAVYFTGLYPPGSDNRTAKAWYAVYVAKLPDRGPAEVFFGDPDKAGSDNTHLNDPRGVAVDGKGYIFVADFGNNRVVVIKEKDKTFAGSFPVEQPSWVAVHPKTGAVYVCSKQTVVIKFSSWQDAKEQARADFTGFRTGLLSKTSRDYHWGTSLCFALDGSAEPPVLWAACVTNSTVASRVGTAQLVRCEDLGSRFSDAAPTPCGGSPLLRRPAADPTHREVACLDGGTLNILNEETGKIRVGGRPGRGSCTASSAANPRLDRDGNIYVSSHEMGLMRYTPEGKPMPFPASASLPPLEGRLPAGATGTTWWEGGFNADRKGDVYVRKDGLRYHGQKTIEVYGQDGRHKRTAIWAISDAAYGPRVDAKGNIYIMEIAKPVGAWFPAEFKDHLVPNPDPKDNDFGPSEPTRPSASAYNWMYGSIIKFGPEGGAVWFGNGQAGPTQLEYEGWRGNFVPDLRTTGGSLTGTISTHPQYPTWLAFPALNLDAATQNKITIRMKNATDGNRVVLGYDKPGRYGGVYPQNGATNPGSSSKVIAITPDSDFTEYTFDLSGEKDWTGRIHWVTLIPSNGKKGTFLIDWVRIGGADSKLVWSFDKEDSQDKKLPATMKKEKAIGDHCPDGIELQGALWMRPGFAPTYSPSGGGERCRCTGTDFDVDDFGRVFAPDLGRFRVGVLDANGNEITSFGAYGNQDFCGPESYVLDPATKLLRPRKEGDPRDLVSPFAKPEIAFAWIIGVAVTDRNAYVGDVVNKRVLRVKLGYAAEAGCDIK